MLPPTFVLALCLAVSGGSPLSGPQQPTDNRDPRLLLKPAKPTIERTGPNTYRIGRLTIDTAKREVVVPGTMNDVSILEFVANTRNGVKAYESAMTIDIDAVTFNAALLLIGLDPARARVPEYHFDPKSPEGDPVEMFVEWDADDAMKRVRVEDLLYDERTKTTLPTGPWTYTGSTFITLGDGRREFMSDMDGVLIGFVHSPAPLIENPRPGAVGAYGAVVLNRNLGLKAGQAVTLTVRALPRQ
jgi:hypothetical protein